jgi:hypothetical protein
MNPLEALMRSAQNDGTLDEDDAPRPKISDIGEAEVLRSMLAEFSARHEFRRGMIVRQKPQCEIYNLFSDNGLAIVVEMLPETLFESSRDSGSASYRQPMDMIIATRAVRSGEAVRLALWHVDSRRFEPAEDLVVEGF